MNLGIINAVGNTPTVLVQGSPSYYAKLEGLNPFGSIKDRAAAYVMQKGYEEGIITSSTEIIESSSGNFAVALAAVCRIYGNKFICVVDKSLMPANRQIIQSYGAEILVADEADENGSYLRDRLIIVKKLLAQNSDLHWINQYDNYHISQAYYDTIGVELSKEFTNIDFLFVPISTCGTISGISRKLKEEFPSIRIVAVDIVGSKIFCESSDEKRYIPGMGASITPGNLSYALIDDVVDVTEKEAIRHCRNLLKKSILVGGSSGATSAAIEKYFRGHAGGTIVAVFPDRGERYLSSIFNDKWCNEIYNM